jgi:plasmid stabilization system protein ParE
LDEAYEFLEAINVAAAAKIYNNILRDVQRLETMPFMGPVEPWLDQEAGMFRYLVSCKRYKVIYCIDDDTVLIADVWDCRQNPDNLKKRIEEMAEV